MAVRIDEQEVQLISQLARLKLTGDEVGTFRRQLGDVLEYMRKLDELNVDGVEPTTHPLPVRDAFREDAPSDSMGADRTLANAPEREGDFFVVPKVLDQESA